jgi:hypothetical protein
LDGLAITGIGLTANVNDIGVPVHETLLFVILGVTVMIEEMTVFVEFVALNEGKVPLPEVEIPVAVLLFDHA